MLKHTTISLILALAACGDNIVPEQDSGFPPVHPELDFPVYPGGDCVDFDNISLCPDAGQDPVDAGVSVEIDASIPELDEETKGACCHALLNGSPPKHECGYPPGLCKNGQKTMFCKNTDGSDSQFDLCNP